MTDDDCLTQRADEVTFPEVQFFGTLQDPSVTSATATLGTASCSNTETRSTHAA
jgi:hypothetical protein